MSQSIIPFIFMFVAMAVIAFSLMLYVYRKGKNSKGVYTAKALELLQRSILLSIQAISSVLSFGLLWA